MRAGLSDRATTVARSPARACSSTASASARSGRRGHPGPAVTVTDCIEIGMDVIGTSTRTIVSRTLGSGTVRGRNPRRTTRTARTASPMSTARNCPPSSVVVRAATPPALSSSATTAPGMGTPLALSRTVPRSDCARASVTAIAPAITSSVRYLYDRTRDRIPCLLPPPFPVPGPVPGRAQRAAYSRFPIPDSLFPTRRPMSTALKPCSPQLITKTLKPCCMRASMSFAVAG